MHDFTLRIFSLLSFDKGSYILEQFVVGMEIFIHETFVLCVFY